METGVEPGRSRNRNGTGQGRKVGGSNAGPEAAGQSVVQRWCSETEAALVLGSAALRNRGCPCCSLEQNKGNGNDVREMWWKGKGCGERWWWVEGTPAATVMPRRL
ncbi:hypothetical protein AAHE18_U054900 [Arachis hypogaea]